MEVDKNSELIISDVWINGNRFRAVKIDGVQFNVIKDIADHFGHSYTYPFLKSLADTEIKKLSSDQLRYLGYSFSSHGLNTISQAATFDFLKKVEKRREVSFQLFFEMHTSLDVKYRETFNKEKYLRAIKHRINEKFEFEQLYLHCCGVGNRGSCK